MAKSAEMLDPMGASPRTNAHPGVPPSLLAPLSSLVKVSLEICRVGAKELRQAELAAEFMSSRSRESSGRGPLLT